MPYDICNIQTNFTTPYLPKFIQQFGFLNKINVNINHAFQFSCIKIALYLLATNHANKKRLINTFIHPITVCCLGMLESENLLNLSTKLSTLLNISTQPATSRLMGIIFWIGHSWKYSEPVQSRCKNTIISIPLYRWLLQ